MAHANQIMLVKTIKRRLNELLSDTGIKTVVKYTSADDMLTVTFRKISKGSAKLLDRKTTLQEYLLGTDILSSLTSEAIEAFKPRWTAQSLANELSDRVDRYDTWNGRAASRDRYPFGFVVTYESRTSSGCYYSICASTGGSSRFFSPRETSTLEEVEQQFEQHAGEATHCEYTRWRASGEPKTRQPELLTATQAYSTWTELIRHMYPPTQTGNAWSTVASNAQMFASGQLPDTLLGRPIIWDCDIDAPSNPEPF